MPPGGEPPKRRILVVDDAPANIRELGEALRPEHTVSGSTTAQEALRIARSDSPPDLILLEAETPGIDGYDLCQRLRSDPQTERIPVILIGSREGERDEVRGLEAGAVDYIHRPFSVEVVRARVRTHLSLRGALEEQERQNAALREAETLKEEIDRITRHELKTPLCAIIGMPQALLLAENLTPRQRHCCQIIEESAQQMLTMINLSADLYRMERGTYALEAVDVDLLPLVDKILVELDREVAEKRLSIKLLLDGRPSDAGATFMVRGEEPLCHAMLTNLLKRAVEASPTGETITVALELGEEGKISFHDRGVVPEGERETFFSKYSRRGVAALGTHSARLMAETLGGRIHLDVTEAEGTTVTVHLPAC